MRIVSVNADRCVRKNNDADRCVSKNNDADNFDFRSARWGWFSWSISHWLCTDTFMLWEINPRKDRQPSKVDGEPGVFYYAESVFLNCQFYFIRTHLVRVYEDDPHFKRTVCVSKKVFLRCQIDIYGEVHPENKFVLIQGEKKWEQQISEWVKVWEKSDSN